MMIVNLQVALANYFEVKQSMPSKERKHVIEKRQASLDTPAAAAIQIQFDADIGLFRPPIDRGRSRCGLLRCRHAFVHSCLKISRKAATNLSFSSGVPTLTRK